ncbi:MAG: glycosyltransferase family 39 protein [Anaerolineae bacterium]|nr:glycosyltransferase family 39 protein [Anaerolineae bacterium]
MTVPQLGQDARLRPAVPSRWAAWRFDWALLAVVMLVGIGLRFYRIDSLPPGLHYDQAENALLAWETYIGQTRPIFYTAYTGMEPLMFYSIAGMMSLVGRTGRAIHLTSAVYGSLTILLTFLLAREAFGGARTWQGRWMGLFTAGLVATSAWHLVNSRNGFRVITLPMCEMATLWALWVAFRTQQRRWYALAGAALGLTAYTYYASRLVPVALVLWLAWLAVGEWRFMRARLGGLAVLLVAATVIATPLFVFYAQNPEYLFVRADQTWALNPDLTGGDTWGAMRDNVVEVLGMFSVKGDHNWRFNIAPWPIFDPLLSILAALGLAVCLWRAWPRRRPPDEDDPVPPWAAYAMTLIWLGIMLIPSFLSVEGRPNSVRGLGALPFVYVLPALGLVVALDWLNRRVQARQRVALAAVVCLALVAGEGIRTAYGYFDYWANAPDTYYHYDTDYVTLAHLAGQELAAGQSEVVVVTEHYKHNSIAWEAPATLDQGRWLDGQQGSVVFPAGQRDIVYFLARTAAEPNSRLRRRLRDVGATFETVATDPVGKPSVVKAVVPRDRAPHVDPTSLTLIGFDNGDDAPPPSLALSLGSDAWLLEGDVPAERPRDGLLRVGAIWQARQALDQARTFAVRLVDSQGQVWGQDDRLSYLSDQWRPGDVGWQQFEMRYDRALPAGPYRLELALTDAERKPLPITGADGSLKGLWTTLGTVEMKADGGEVDQAQAGQDQGSGLRLVRQPTLDAVVPPGGSTTLGLTWQRSEGQPAETMSLEWLDAAGQAVARQTLPIATTYPPSRWRVGEIVKPRYRVTPPTTLEVGAYRLRLRVGDAGPVDLGKIAVQGPPRRFEPGPIQHSVSARLGSSITLLGYDVAPTPAAPGQPLRVTLHWRALAAPDRGYTRFLHLVDAGGQLRAQSDSPPAGGTRPTTGWVEGEVVADTVQLTLPADLPPGRYHLLTGLYDPTTLARLPALNAANAPWPNAAVDLGEIEIQR